MITPLDPGLPFSSILQEDDAVFKVFMTMASQAGEDEVARLSVPQMAKLMSKSIEEVMGCLKVLESPDPHSRSTTAEGRRIERVDGGWRIINIGTYRKRAMEELLAKRGIQEPTEEELARDREANRLRQQRWRERQEQGSHPLVQGRRPEIEKRVYATVREISALDPSRDPTEILAKAATYIDPYGRSHTRTRPEVMSDDYLIRTLVTLEEDLAALKASKVPTP